ncbi:DUF4386 domain-containing protein [Saprospiraceae bacterium]|nr:DUF4386 domain-containing protein [Saprospiraceae bacterium]
MTEITNQIQAMTYAKFAGLLYLLIAISGGFSIGYMPSVIIVSDDAATTAQNLLENQGLFRLGILGDIVIILLEIILTVILYRLFKPINQTISMIAAFARLSMSIVMGLNLLNYLIPYHLLNSANNLVAFEIDELQSLVLVFLEAHEYGVYIWGLFFGLHLISLGYLVFKSGYFPKVLGLLMGIGSFGYSLESIGEITLTHNELFSILVIALLVIVTIGELSFTFWLLIKGLNIEEWNKRNFKRVNKN